MTEVHDRNELVNRLRKLLSRCGEHGLYIYEEGTDRLLSVKVDSVTDDGAKFKFGPSVIFQSFDYMIFNWPLRKQGMLSPSGAVGWWDGEGVRVG